jgi:hypothetical protein
LADISAIELKEVKILERAESDESASVKETVAPDLKI